MILCRIEEVSALILRAKGEALSVSKDGPWGRIARTHKSGSAKPLSDVRFAPNATELP